MTTLLDVRGISRTYAGPPTVVALAEATFSIAEGDFVVVVGPSGSGKSTLLNVMGLLDRPTAGSYYIRGTDVGRLSESERARFRGTHIGFVFQSFHLLEQRSCLENVMLSDLYIGTDQLASMRRATEALSAVGLGSMLSRSPTELSGGQQQRVAIARAISSQPSVILCDEPTGNLDSETAAAMMDLFVDLNSSGRTIIMITHDPVVAGFGNRTLRILDGVVTELA